MGGCCVTGADYSDVYIAEEDPKFSEPIYPPCPFDSTTTKSNALVSDARSSFYAIRSSGGGGKPVCGHPVMNSPHRYSSPLGVRPAASPVLYRSSNGFQNHSRPLPNSPGLAPLKTIHTMDLPRLPSPVPLSSGRCSPVVYPIPAPFRPRSASPSFKFPSYAPWGASRAASPSPAIPVGQIHNNNPPFRYFTPQRMRTPYDHQFQAPLTQQPLRSRSASPMPRAQLFLRPAIVPGTGKNIGQLRSTTPASRSQTPQHHCNLPFHDCLGHHQRSVVSPQNPPLGFFRASPFNGLNFPGSSSSSSNSVGFASPPPKYESQLPFLTDDLIPPPQRCEERRLSLSSASDPEPYEPIEPPPPPSPRQSPDPSHCPSPIVMVPSFPPNYPDAPPPAGMSSSPRTGRGSPRAVQPHNRQYGRLPNLPRRIDSPDNSPRNQERSSNWGSFRRDSRSHLRREDSAMMMSVHQMQLQLSHIRRDDQLQPQNVQWSHA